MLPVSREQGQRITHSAPVPGARVAAANGAGGCRTLSPQVVDLPRLPVDQERPHIIDRVVGRDASVPALVQPSLVLRADHDAVAGDVGADEPPQHVLVGEVVHGLWTAQLLQRTQAQDHSGRPTGGQQWQVWWGSLGASHRRAAVASFVGITRGVPQAGSSGSFQGVAGRAPGSAALTARWSWRRAGRSTGCCNRRCSFRTGARTRCS